ncbi:MAG: S8 family serine peptidase [Rubrivivax sp.]|nr:S8 family serine peptidase [Rubrivivax sp.]
MASLHRRLRGGLIPALLAAALAGVVAPAAAPEAKAATPAARKAASAVAARKPLPPVPGEVIVRFKADAATLKTHALAAAAKPQDVSAVLARRAATLGARVGRPLEAGEAVGDRMQVVRLGGADAAELARRLAADPEVEFAEPNGRQRRLQTVPPNDPLYAFGSRQPNGPDAGQWYLRPPDGTFVSAANVQGAWARGFGSASVVVAVLDTGVRFEHPDLGRVATGGKLLPGYDFVTDVAVANDGDARDADPSDPGDWVSAGEAGVGVFDDCFESPSSWHGTATASLVGAMAGNAIGMAGAAPGVRVLPVRVLGKCFGRDSDIQAAMRWAAGISVAGVPDNQNPAKVLNLSLGSSNACSAAYQAAVDEIVARGVVIVAAAGNDTGKPVGVPANCNGVVAVGGLRHVGTKVGFSDLGPQIALSAPGGNCVNIGPNEPCLYPVLAALDAGLTGPQASIWSDSFDFTVGTSFAAPQVAGVVGLLFSQSPSLTAAQVRTLLQGTVRPFPTTGGTAGTPVCAAPSAGVDQLECYCPNPGAAGYPLCGAGMLDAASAVTAAATGLAVIDVTSGAAVRGQAVTLSATRSIVAPGRSIASWSWSLVNGGGAVSAFTGAVDASTAALTPTATGTFVVGLTVTDSAGASKTATVSVTVAEPAPTSSSGSGSGATSPLWTALLVLAVLALARVRRPGAQRERPR